MKKAFLILLLFLPFMVWSQEFDNVVDFSQELSSLSTPETAGMVSEDGRLVILEGITDSVISFEGDFWLRMLGGEWIGTEEVRAYTCLIRVDRSWQKYFPIEMSGIENDESVPSGSRIIAVVRVLGWSDSVDEPQAEMIDFRILK